jgi:cytochrome c553
MKLLPGLTVLFSLIGGAALATEPASSLKAEPLPEHKLPASKDGNLVVGLCDGETSMEVKGVKEGGQMSRPQALQVTGALMDEWRRKNPNANWDDVPAPAQGVAQASQPSPSPNPQKPTAGGSTNTAGQSAASGAPQVAAQKGANVLTGHTYGSFGERDEKIWAESTQAFVEEGNRIFHDAAAVGGTIAVSCDMCHPNAANTHPETYPKYQVQLGRVALLRDMINWCIQNPVRGKLLADGDPKMKALEAFIYAQRKGTPLEYGKH